MGGNLVFPIIRKIILVKNRFAGISPKKYLCWFSVLFSKSSSRDSKTALPHPTRSRTVNRSSNSPNSLHGAILLQQQPQIALLRVSCDRLPPRKHIVHRFGYIVSSSLLWYPELNGTVSSCWDDTFEVKSQGDCVPAIASSIAFLVSASVSPSKSISAYCCLITRSHRPSRITLCRGVRAFSSR